jgi:hypothetical protein
MSDIYVAFLALRQPNKVVTPYKRHTLYVTSRKSTIGSGLRYKIIWAAGFAAPDGQRFALTTRRLDNAARYPQLHSPSNNEGILFLEGMKEKKREDCRGSGAILPCYDVQAEDSFTTRKPGIPQVHWVLHAAYAGTANDALIFARSKDRASTRGVPARSLPPWLM